MKALATYLITAIVGLAAGYSVSKRAQADPVVEAERSSGSATEGAARVSLHEWNAARELTGEAASDGLMALAGEMPPGEIEAALATLHLPHEQDIAKCLLETLAKADPERAIALLDSLPIAETTMVKTGRGYWSQNDRVRCRIGVVSAWAKHDPEGAMGYLESFRDAKPEWSSKPDRLFEWVISNVNKVDPKAALRFRERWGGEVGGPWIKIDEDLEPQLEQIEDEVERATARSKALRVLAESDKDSVLRALFALPAGEKLGSAFGWTRYRYSSEELMDLEAHGMGERYETTNWAEVKLKKGELDRWASRDPRAAVGWTDGLPENAREHFRAQALVGAALNDPEWAVPEIEKLSPAMFAKVAVKIAPEWAHRDTDGAREWVEGLEDVALRESVLKVLPK